MSEQAPGGDMTENIRAQGEAAEEAAYDPSGDLTRIGRAEYLEVKNRIKWLRDTDPQARIECELLREDKDSALFKATVELTTGGKASAHGSETKGDFRDFLEKAETKALGRALAMLGFGTQFVESELDGKKGSRPVDAPVRRARERQVQELNRERPARAQNAQNRSERAENGSRADDTGREGNAAQAQSEKPAPERRVMKGESDKPIADRQKKAILDLAKRGGYGGDDLDALVAQFSGGSISVDDLTFDEAAGVITALRKPKGDSGKE